MTPSAPKGPYRVEPWGGRAIGFHILDSEGKILCSIGPRKQGDVESIAHLIASSPDLLRVAKLALQAVSSRLNQIEYEALSQAIDKAEGRV